MSVVHRVVGRICSSIVAKQYHSASVLVRRTAVAISKETSQQGRAVMRRSLGPTTAEAELSTSVHHCIFACENVFYAGTLLHQLASALRFGDSFDTPYSLPTHTDTHTDSTRKLFWVLCFYGTGASGLVWGIL
jgi:hypothetical protein